MFECSKVYYANYLSEADITINQGGTDSGKTYAIMQLLFTYALTINPPKIDPVITIVGESIPNLKAGAYRIGQSIYENTPEILDAVLMWNRSDMTFIFKNGWKMEFKSYETEQQAKQGKRQFSFFNEANGINWMIFWQVAKRTRQKVFIDYNPSAPFWAHEKLIETTPESNDLSATVNLIISDHRHNPFLSEKDHARTEGIKDPELWRVYARGLTGNLQGLIYVNWKQIPDEDFPQEDGLFGGVDFGYTNDPTAAVACVRVANNIYVKELCYQTAMTPMQLTTLFKSCGFGENTPIYCEHDGDMIRQLRTLELLAVAARKGAGSINAGISKVKEYNIFYTASSKNIEFERSKYMWLIDKETGKPVNTPVETNNHLMDAIRYAIYTNFYRQE
jgi:phage terminase large subunit